MNEDKPTEKEIRAFGAHPEKRPTPPLGLDDLHHMAEHKGRRALMSGPGLFDGPIEDQVEQEEAQVQSAVDAQVESVTPVQSELEPRKLKFNKGTRLYRLVHDSEHRPIVPRTPAQERDLFDRELTVPTYFNVPVEFLEMGARGKTITKRVGKSNYGAFTVVLCPVHQSNGEIVLEERLASYLTRSSKKQL
jgi:hypothetical protein